MSIDILVFANVTNISFKLLDETKCYPQAAGDSVNGLIMSFSGRLM
jgi:hypothetical protein